ncbi:MAG: T9SS type A sorting domain-containing protein [Saprospiraceae bacterium]|jgi:hypothetical protein
MKQIIHIFLAFSPLAFVSAQTLRIEPGDVKQTFKVNLADPLLNLELYASVRNIGSDTIRLKWQRREASQPSGWQTQVCDGVECYLPIVSSNVDPNLGLNAPFVLPPNKKADFIFHVLPNQTAGTGKFAIRFSSAQKPDSILASMNFEVNVQSLVTSSKESQPGSIQVFPNPASDFFMLNTIEDVDQLVLYNLLGVPVKTYLAEYGQRYSLNNVVDGVYLLALVNKNKGTIRTMRIIKRGVRS